MSEREQLDQAIAAMQAQRSALGDAVVDAAIAAFRARLEKLPKPSQEFQAHSPEGGQTTAFLALEIEAPSANLESLWENLEAILAENGGTIHQRAQSSLLAIFGLPTTQSNDTERAAWAALALQQAIRLQGGSLSLRIALHTAALIMPDSTPLSEVRLPAEAERILDRLVKAALPWEILISQEAYQHLRGIFDLQTHEPLLLRGKSRSVQIYRLRSGRARTIQTGPLSPGRDIQPMPLVGRSQELQTLLDSYRASLTNRELNIITLYGEAGMGKTRLAAEFYEQAGRKTGTDPLLLQAGCQPEDLQTPFALLRSLLANYYHLDISAPVDLIRTQLENEFRVLLRMDGIEAAHLLGHLAGFDFSPSPFVQRYSARTPLRGASLWGRENANALRQRALQLCPRFFQALAGTRPLILVLDNLHWADSHSLAMIDGLIQQPANFPALALCLTRPSLLEDQPDRWVSSPSEIGNQWGQSWKRHTRIHLEPLAEAEVARFSANWLNLASDQSLPAGLLEALREPANGNPLFIGEMLRMWVEDQTIQFVQGEWIFRPQALDRRKAPSSLTEIMQTRLESLPIPERDLLKRAAVIGRVFWLQALEALAPHTSEDLETLVQSLCKRGLIVERNLSSLPGCREFHFTHSLLHQVAYDTILQRMRPGYHAHSAEWLQFQAQRLQNYAYALSIAEHYEKAGQFDTSGLWYEYAGDHASSRYQPETALKYYQKSLQTLQTPNFHKRLELLKKIGDTLWWMANYAQAVQIAEAQAEIAQANQAFPEWADALNRISAIQNRMGDHSAALKYAEEAGQVATRANALPELSAALFYRGVSLFRLGNNQEALAVAQESLLLNQRLGDENQLPSANADFVRSLNLLGMIHQTTGNHPAAWENFSRVLEFHRANNNPSGAIAALNNLGVYAHTRGEYPTAIANYQQALDEARRVGYRDIEWICLSNLSGAQAEQGNFRMAEDGLRKVLENSEASGWFMLGETKRFLALALLGQRRRQEALEFARESLESSRKSGSREYIGRAWRVLGMIARQSPTHSVILPDQNQSPPAADKEYRAADCFSASQEVLQQINARGDLARTRLEWARFELQFGSPVLGRQLWEQARTGFENLEMNEELLRMEADPLRPPDASESSTT